MQYSLECAYTLKLFWTHKVQRLRKDVQGMMIRLAHNYVGPWQRYKTNLEYSVSSPMTHNEISLSTAENLLRFFNQATMPAYSVKEKSQARNC